MTAKQRAKRKVAAIQTVTWFLTGYKDGSRGFCYMLPTLENKDGK